MFYLKMGQEQITLEQIHSAIQNMQFQIDKINKRLEKQNIEIVDLDNSNFLADEKLLAEDWLSPEDEEAWKDL